MELTVICALVLMATPDQTVKQVNIMFVIFLFCTDIVLATIRHIIYVGRQNDSNDFL